MVCVSEDDSASKVARVKKLWFMAQMIMCVFKSMIVHKKMIIVRVGEYGGEIYGLDRLSYNI